jgi:hypothetical protein
MYYIYMTSCARQLRPAKLVHRYAAFSTNTLTVGFNGGAGGVFIRAPGDQTVVADFFSSASSSISCKRKTHPFIHTYLTIPFYFYAQNRRI